MEQAVCVDTDGTLTLTKGKTYYLFPDGKGSAFVSKFPRQSAHMGCFNTKHFIIQKDEWPAEPSTDHVPDLDRSKHYKARLIWRRKGYSEKALKDYYLKVKNTHASFFHDAAFKDHGGCFPLHWFDDFQVVEPEAVEEEPVDEPEEPENFVQMTLF